MHKKNLHRNTDSIRFARAAQVRLDEISDKIEREKHKSIKSNYHEKVKIWNELKSIRRVFEPLYVIKENQDRLARNQSAPSKVDSKDRADDSGRKGRDAAVSVKQPRLLRRSETQSNTMLSRRRHTEPKIMAFEGWTAKTDSSTCQNNLVDPALLRPRSRSWSLLSTSETERAQSAPDQKVEREHFAKLRSATEEPHVSDSMSSITMGYLAFKRVLKNKKLSEGMERKVVDSRFRSMSMHEAELSANSRLVMPEHSDAMHENEDSLQELFPTAQKTINPHLVRKDNIKQNPGLKKRLSTGVGSRRQLVSSLSWPLGELPMRPADSGTNLLAPDLLRPQSTEVPRSRSEMSVRERPAVKTERAKTGKALGSNVQERSRESDEEFKFGTFDENPCEKPKHKRLNRTLSRGSRLLKPLGTGCFSESFQSLSHSKK